jgi:nucleosome assembly protein 1-like 1
MVSGKEPDIAGFEKEAKEGIQECQAHHKTEQCDSFFNFFNPPQVPDDDDDIDEETVSSMSLHGRAI